MFSLVQNLTSALRAHEAKSLSDNNREGRDEHERFDAYPRDKFGSAQPENQDGSSISIQSLIWFFEDYLQSRLGKSSRKNTVSNSIKPWIKTAHSNSNEGVISLAKAAQKYDENSDMAFDTLSDTHHGQDEIRHELKKIYFLIQDLRILDDAGVETLLIKNDKPFMSGVFAAVESYKKAS
jgi:hypothetical protein